MKFIGIDNGVSGSITIIKDKFNMAEYYSTPTFKDLSHTKKAKWMRRIDTAKLRDILYGVDVDESVNGGRSALHAEGSMVYIERPMINPTRFNVSLNASRAFEATLIIIEQMELPYEVIDSKLWQGMLLPKGLKGSDKLKAAAKVVAKRIFPHIQLKGKQDADSMCIAEYGRRKYKQNIGGSKDD